MKYLKLFEGRLPSSPFGNKEVCFKKNWSRTQEDFYTEMIHIPNVDDDNSGLYVETQVNKLTSERTIIKCGTYQLDGSSVRYKYSFQLPR